MTQGEAEAAIETLLRFLGEDVSRDGLRDTPRRVVKAWQEVTQGYNQFPADILSCVFEEDAQEMITLANIAFYSTCEHHLLPFNGTASVAYLPGKVVGISKLARLVQCFAQRLQIQERLTRQIADAVSLHLEAPGVGVLIKAHHLCMGCRGARQPNTTMITSAMLGEFQKDNVRREFLQIIA